MALQNYINGSFTDSVTGATDDVINPATGEVITAVASSDSADADVAVAAAAKAFETWSYTTPRERSEKLLALAQILEDNLEELKELETKNVGKPVSITEFEFDLTIDNIRFFAGAARTLPCRPDTQASPGRIAGAHGSRRASAPTSSHRW